MALDKVVVNIEGEYVDSYIYSGYLVLINDEYRLTVYKWRDLFDRNSLGFGLVEFMFLESFLNDSRRKFPKIKNNEIFISKAVLKRAERCSFDIGVWPTDISIFSSRLYISSESGLLRLDVSYEDGTLSNERKLFDDMCFSVSPNSYGRLAFAAGKSGVLTLIPTSKYYNANDVRQLISETCLDVDWQSNKLLASTVNGVFEASFAKMPDRDDFSIERDFFDAVNQCKNIKPEIRNTKELRFSWMAGDKTYALGHDCSLIIEDGEGCTRSDIGVSNNILRARTAAFGTVVETDDVIIGFTGAGVIEFARNPVSWRVFPRAKNYAGQLHVVNDNYLAINVIEVGGDNIFGFDPERIDLRG